MNDALQYASQNRETHLRELIQFLSIPSVSTQPEHTSDVEDAARWLAAVRAFRDRLGAATIGNDEQYARTLTAVREALAASQFEAAWIAGLDVPIEFAVAEAISETAHVARDIHAISRLRD